MGEVYARVAPSLATATIRSSEHIHKKRETSMREITVEYAQSKLSGCALARTWYNVRLDPRTPSLHDAFDFVRRNAPFTLLIVVHPRTNDADCVDQARGVSEAVSPHELEKEMHFPWSQVRVAKRYRIRQILDHMRPSTRHKYDLACMLMNDTHAMLPHVHLLFLGQANCRCVFFVLEEGIELGLLLCRCQKPQLLATNEIEVCIRAKKSRHAAQCRILLEREATHTIEHMSQRRVAKANQQMCLLNTHVSRRTSTKYGVAQTMILLSIFRYHL